MNRIRNSVTALLLGCSMAVAPGVAHPQDVHAPARLIDLDAPSVPAPRSWLATADIRALSGDEDMTYTSVGVGVGLRPGWEAMLRGSFGGTHDFALSGGNAIRHGGTDVELLAKFACTGRERIRAAGLIGVSFPNTPSQTSAPLTLGAAVAAHTGSVELVANPRAVFAGDNAIVGFGLGASAHLGGAFWLTGDWTPIVSGHNTRDTSTGAAIQRDVWGAALSVRSRNGRLQADFGYANATGMTTGTSLTPALGGSGGFYFALTGRS